MPFRSPGFQVRISDSGRLDAVLDLGRGAWEIVETVFTMVMFRSVSLTLPLFALSLDAAPIKRIWLSHATEDPSALVVNWETESPARSVVDFGDGPELGERVVETAEKATRHHVAIPFGHGGGRLFYRVGEGDEMSAVHSVKRYPEDELRIAVVGDWGYAPGRDFSSLLVDDPHLLLTAGDNVASLHQAGKEGTKAFAALIDAHSEIFRSIPFLPILGNHDRELTPRGPKPPEHPVYDVEATAFREFFALPGDEWKWRFRIPRFDLALVALDLNHVQDHGTTWQTCHAWQTDSPQFLWYAKTMDELESGFVVTLMNEKRTSLEAAGKGAWLGHFQKGSALVTGFGYFAERAELEGGLPYFNTCLKGDGDLYKDPASRFHARVDNYLLLTLREGAPTMKAELKGLDGLVLDTLEIPQRGASQR